jgi:hypothetical protein
MNSTILTHNQSAAMVLAKALYDKANEMEEDGSSRGEAGHVLPEIPLHEARYIMTRADFIQQYDHINIFTIDSNANVRADSVVMQNAFKSICSQPGFDERLEATLTRIGDIESLGRTREVTIKDLWNGGKYNLSVKTGKGYLDKLISFEVEGGANAANEEDDEDD